MEIKKTKKANLERFKGLFFQIGLVITLILVFTAFEWATIFKTINSSVTTRGVEITEIDIPITRSVPDLPPPPPPMPTETYLIVDEPIDLGDELDMLPTEIGAEEIIEPFDWSLYEKEEKSIDETIFKDFEVAPKFQGKDDNAFRQYIVDNIRFPEEAINNGIDGLIQVRFVVNIDGTLCNIEIDRGVDKFLDDEVLRVISKSPKWEAGIKNGKRIRAQYYIRIRFRLQ